jgi:hypothetical protein
MKTLVLERLKEAVQSEYPPGQVTIRTFDARAILALLGEGGDPGPDDDPDPCEAGTCEHACGCMNSA